MRQLPALNAQRFFCSVCGIGEQGKCFHVEELKREGSRVRHYGWLVVGLFICAAIVLVYGLIVARGI